MTKARAVPDRICEYDGAPYPGRYPSGAIRHSTRFCSNSHALRAVRAGRKQSPRPAGWTKGMSRDRLYGVWKQEVRRCTVPGSQQWHTHGGRGIEIYAPWTGRDGYLRWRTYVLEEIPPHPEDGQHWTIDRIDNDGNYEPGNLRWATPKTQANNKRKRPPGRGGLTSKDLH